MHRYDICEQNEKEALHRLYDYLGFNEVTSFNNFLEFFFAKTKITITFEQVFNHFLKHIVTSFWADYPRYRSNYIKMFWIKPKDYIESMTVGSNIEYDPKGIIRLFVKNNYDKLVNTKR